MSEVDRLLDARLARAVKRRQLEDERDRWAATNLYGRSIEEVCSIELRIRDLNKEIAKLGDD